MPKVMLIKVPSYSDVISPPLGIGYLASSLKKIAGVVIIDGVKIRLKSKQLGSILKDVEPDVVGLSVVSAAAKNALEYAREIKRNRPGSVIVAGGPHPSLVPEDFYNAAGGDIDYILRGDAELSFKKLVELKALKYYLYAFRNVKVYNEHVINKILIDLRKILFPRELTIVAEFTARGGMKSKVTCSYFSKKPK